MESDHDELERFRLEERSAESICQDRKLLEGLVDPATLVITGRVVAKKLQKLHLHHFSQLVKLPEHLFESLTELREIELRDCPKLVLDENTVQHAPPYGNTLTLHLPTRPPP